ncbi:thiosulfate sulfurtransferase [Pluteus cervinus]|uniref:Thiosulfate sulfurtransferase n=1 Tax=Pluteus cervinus TaxID=181527 RepID=A0ACD3BGT1_9AGAR|nr:thiosulfate sulfurtransferase [Pluteus cervinus]
MTTMLTIAASSCRRQLIGLRHTPATFSTIYTTYRRMSATRETPLLLSPAQVKDLAKSSKISVLDATWFMPNSPRNARDEYLTSRIPQAQFLDLDEVASPHELGLKHMMPSPEIFADACERIGISPTSHVVIYDSHGVFSSARALFMFRAFGHEKSSIIDGGLPRWVAESLPIEMGASTYQPVKTSYSKPQLATETVRNYEQMVTNSSLDLSSPESELVLDARPRGRYLGQDPEPRPGLPSGHIPRSFSLPFDTFLQQHTAPNGNTYTRFLPYTELNAALAKAVGPEEAESIIAGRKPVTTTCGSGMTAGVLWLGLKLLGVKDVALYDESWTGYASRAQSVVARG